MADEENILKRSGGSTSAEAERIRKCDSSAVKQVQSNLHPRINICLGQDKTLNGEQGILLTRNNIAAGKPPGQVAIKISPTDNRDAKQAKQLLLNERISVLKVIFN